MTALREIGFSLGSNQGERLSHLSEAKDRLFRCLDAEPAGSSCVYETEPVGVRPEYEELDFLNAVVLLNSRYSIEHWLQEAGRIEEALGRVRSGDRNAPRYIDIDLLYAGEEWMDDGGIRVPHPRWAERLFVVQPLCELRPAVKLPDHPETVADICMRLSGTYRVTHFAGEW